MPGLENWGGRLKSLLHTLPEDTTSQARLSSTGLFYFFESGWTLTVCLHSGGLTPGVADSLRSCCGTHSYGNNATQ